jgi:hypothetical protein
MQLAGAADLDPARSPGVDAGEVVDHDRHLGVGLQVSVLLGLGEAVAPDIDGRAILGSVAGIGVDPSRRPASSNSRPVADRRGRSPT